MGLISGVIPLLIIGAFACGIVWAGKYTKNGFMQFFVGMIMGFGILLALVGVLFAGCCAVLALSNHRYGP